jgi:uncharacterized OB-fold protein
MKEYLDYTREPLPDVDFKDGAPFWEGTRRGEIRFPKCLDCGQFHWYPAVLCPHCHSPRPNIEWQALTSQPRLFTWTYVNWNLPVVAIRGPLIVILVEYDEAPDLYLTSNLVECRPEDIEIGMPLEAVFQKVDDRLTMPLFRPIKAE